MADDLECRYDVLLDCPRDRAFSVVVDQPQMWWVSPFSGAAAEPVEAGIDPFAGGSCYEMDGEGRRRTWGTVLSIEAPLYIRLAWQVSQEGGEVADPLAASRVMMNFREAGDKTRLEIVHSEFLRHGEHGAEYLSQIRRQEGWPALIARLQTAARAAPSR